MTLIAENTAEGGTNGSAVTAGVAGSGNAWDAVVNTSGVITWDNTHVDYGSLAIKVAMLTAVCRVSWTSTTLGTRSELYYAGNFYFTGSPTSSCHFVEGVTSGAVQAWAVDIASTGKLFIRNAANANVYTSTNSIPVNTWCRVEVHYVAGTSTGTLQVRLYTADTDTSPLEDSGAISTNTGADTSRLDVGALTGSTALPAYWAGDQRVGDAAGGWLGPLSATYSGASAMTSATSLASSATASGQNTSAMTSGTALTGAPAAILAAGSAFTSATSLTGSPYTPIGAQLVLGGVQWIAHRGGFAATLGECTLEAYRAAAAQYSRALLELPVWRSVDGTYWISHDKLTGTRSVWTGPGGSIDITASTDAVLAGYTSTVSGFPMRKLTDVLDALPHRFFVVDNKQDTNAAALITVLEAHVAGRWMGKQTWTAYATWLTACQNAGAPVWAYFYPTDLPSGSTANLATTLAALSPAKSPIVFGLGDYSTAPVPVQADADAFFGFTTAHGLLTWAHILGSSGQKSTADGQATTDGTAFNGYMTSGFAALAPNDGLTSPMTSSTALTGTATLGAQASGAMTSGTVLAAQPSLGAAAAGPMLSGTSLTGPAGLGAQVAGAMLSSTLLGGSPTVGELAASVLVSPTSLAGAETVGEQLAGALTTATVLASAGTTGLNTAMTSASSLTGSPALGAQTATALASTTALAGAVTAAVLPAAAALVSATSLGSTAALAVATIVDAPHATATAGSLLDVLTSTGHLISATAGTS